MTLPLSVSSCSASTNLFVGGGSTDASQKHEGFGLTVIEAMASGLPSFATRYVGPSELAAALA